MCQSWVNVLWEKSFFKISRMAFCLFIEFVDLLRCHKATCSWQFRTRMIRELNTSMASVWPMGPAMAHFVIPVRGEAPLQHTKQIQVYAVWVLAWVSCWFQWTAKRKWLQKQQPSCSVCLETNLQGLLLNGIQYFLSHFIYTLSALLRSFPWKTQKKS